MQPGWCHLCGMWKELQHSHIWPKHGYKRYVANPGKGGRFADLQTLKNHNWQRKEYWFCELCEQQFGECYAGEFLTHVEQYDIDEYVYKGELLRYVTSITWRTAKYYAPRARTSHYRELLRNPSKRWKQFLKGDRRDLAPFTQHAFVDRGGGSNRAESIGAEVFPNEFLILSRMGPLLIIGLLGRSHLTLEGINKWEESIVSSNGGTVKPISGRKGYTVALLPGGLHTALTKVERFCAERAAKMPSTRGG